MEKMNRDSAYDRVDDAAVKCSPKDADDASSADSSRAKGTDGKGKIDGERQKKNQQRGSHEITMTDDRISPSENAPEEPRKEFYEVIGVKFKPTGKLYYFEPNGISAKEDDHIIVETARGQEYGVVAMGNRTISGKDVVLPMRQAIRLATAEDEERRTSIIRRENEAFNFCLTRIEERRLGMKLVDVEYTFDGSKMLFYFTADGRIDFRELVKDLASNFRTRIELRQIGIRDEAKMMGGLGICGNPFCCASFLPDFVQVSIKMAKEQNLSLNTAKISGACGRLMCCLRYEYDTYVEEAAKTPKVDAIVATPDGDGVVTESSPLTGYVKVRLNKDAMAVHLYHRDDLTVIGSAKHHKNQSQNQENGQNEPRENESQKDGESKTDDCPDDHKKQGKRPPNFYGNGKNSDKRKKVRDGRFDNGKEQEQPETPKPVAAVDESAGKQNN